MKANLFSPYIEICILYAERYSMWKNIFDKENCICICTLYMNNSHMYTLWTSVQLVKKHTLLCTLGVSTCK